MLVVRWETRTRTCFERSPGLSGAGRLVPGGFEGRTDLGGVEIAGTRHRDGGGQDAGEFDSRLPTGWLLVVAIHLAHAASEERGSGRLAGADADRAFTTSLLRILARRAHAPGYRNLRSGKPRRSEGLHGCPAPPP
ncbi:hypothetical protein [Nocardia sp. X0981]